MIPLAILSGHSHDCLIATQGDHGRCPSCDVRSETGLENFTPPARAVKHGPGADLIGKQTHLEARDMLPPLLRDLPLVFRYSFTNCVEVRRLFAVFFGDSRVGS